MLIIEGADCVGKTTFARKLMKELSKTLPYSYRHLSRLPPSWEVGDYVGCCNRHVVQDRFHLSEIVYAHMRGDDTILPEESYRWLDGILRLFGAFTVVITATPTLIEERWREDEMYSPAQTTLANALYIEYDGGLYDRYTPDVDFEISCHQERPYPDEDDLRRVLSRYRERLALVPTFNQFNGLI